VPCLGLLLASPGCLARKRTATNQLRVSVVMQDNRQSVHHASLGHHMVSRVVAEEPNAGVSANTSRRRVSGELSSAFQPARMVGDDPT